MSDSNMHTAIRNRMISSAWWLYEERNWLRNMILFHEQTIERFKKQLSEYDVRIERFENYLRTGR